MPARPVEKIPARKAKQKKKNTETPQESRQVKTSQRNQERSNLPVSDMVPPYHGGPVGISDFPARGFIALLRFRKLPPFHSRAAASEVVLCCRPSDCLESSEVCCVWRGGGPSGMKAYSRCRVFMLQPGWSKRLAGSEADETLSRSEGGWVLVGLLQGENFGLA